MKEVSLQIVRMFNEERALLMLLAAKRDVASADVLRMGLYQLAAMEGLHAETQHAVQRRVDHVLEEEGVSDGLPAEETTGYARSETAHTGGFVMERDHPDRLPERARKRPRQVKHPMGPERRVLCRRCHSGVLQLFMCGPRLRGRCQDCGTVWVYLWSCAKQGWFQWSN